MALVSDLGAMCICQGAGEKKGGGVTNSSGNHEENGWRQGDVGGERGAEVALMKRRRVGRGTETRPRQERGTVID